MKLFKLNRIIHRDLGYVFFAASVIYGLSGIALNHIKDWNPNYIVSSSTYQTEFIGENSISENEIKLFLESIDEKGSYKKHYVSGENTIKVFVDNGTLYLNTETGIANLDKLKRRPVFHSFNYLHYNHSKRLWTWFADIYAISLIWLAVSGLFMVKGKNGITRRGAVLTVLGVIIPALLFFMYA